jgi:hypothetical protein
MAFAGLDVTTRQVEEDDVASQLADLVSAARQIRELYIATRSHARRL